MKNELSSFSILEQIYFSLLFTYTQAPLEIVLKTSVLLIRFL